MIIGLTGPLCAGTDTFGDIMKKEKGFLWFSYSDVLREEARKKGVKITRVLLQDLGDELRRNEGLGVLSKRLIEKMEDGKDYVIGNIRNPGEVEVMREKFGSDFVLVRIDADLMVRFERLLKRRREKDPETFEDFRKVEERDFGENEEAYGQQHAAVFSLADFSIDNSKTFEEFRARVEDLFGELKKGKA